MDYCRVNVGAFDDPMLLHLDDKVLLHKLLTSSSSAAMAETAQFWPLGFACAASAQPLLAPGVVATSGDVWIRKQRAGYGSHGNTIARASLERVKALAVKNDYSGAGDDSVVLMQQMVEPPLLLNRRKFSLRVYVVIFGALSPFLGSEVFISEEGLVKVAAAPYQPSSFRDTGPEAVDPQVHMTNSGRDTDMQQETFQYLRSLLSTSSFHAIWSSIVTSVGAVMRIYDEHSKVTNRSHEAVGYKLATLGIPKILGFDFVVDASYRAWLVEVNRFPGLEPRSERDAPVKHQVVRDAWQAAARRCDDFDERDRLLSFLASDFADLVCVDSTANMLHQLDCVKKQAGVSNCVKPKRSIEENHP